MVVVQAGLGLRIGELLALRVQDVNQVAGIARIEFQIAPGERSRTEPKTPTSRRTIPLPRVAEALREHMKAFPPLPDGTLFGTRLVAVAERLGHENASLVLSTYGQLVANSEDRTRRAIDTAWESAPDVPQDGGGAP